MKVTVLATVLCCAVSAVARLLLLSVTAREEGSAVSKEVWMHDALSAECVLCFRAFTMMLRRHHWCGPTHNQTHAHTHWRDSQSAAQLHSTD